MPKIWADNHLLEVSERTLVLAGELAIVWLPNCAIKLQIFEKEKALLLSFSTPKGFRFDLAEAELFDYYKLYFNAIEKCKDPVFIRSIFD